MRLDLKDGLNAARVQRHTERCLPKRGTTSRRGFGFPIQHLRGKRWFCLFEPIDVDVFTGVWRYDGGTAAAAPVRSANFVSAHRKSTRSPAKASESAHPHATLTAE